MTPHEIKFALDRQLAKRGSQIVGIHSVVEEEGMVSVGYDLDEPDGETLFFEFERPAQVGRDELGFFATWLAWSDVDRTIH